MTATIDLSQREIATKYQELILYRYDLKSFRMDGFSKDVMIHQVDSEVENRMLHAILISQYRKKVASQHGIFLKPVILFKSKVTADNKGNFAIFNEMLDNLSVEQLEGVHQVALEGILKQAMSFYEKEGISDLDLIAELQDEFRKERLTVIDSTNKEPEKMRLLNTMEEKGNETRAIFAVDMLNEGWDVLNLFDIVRLYDTRDGETDKKGNYKPGATTISEMQLIGRGARYFPFVIEGDYASRFKRKFDEELLNPLRVLEQLHYHSKSNSRYIGELKQALTQAGIYDDTQNEVEISLKPSFKETLTYKKGKVFVNERLAKEKRLALNMPMNLFSTSEDANRFIQIPNLFEIDLPTHQMSETGVFIDDNRISGLETKTEPFTLGNGNFGFGDHILRKALNRNKSFTFRNLQKSFPAINSMENFIAELKNIELRVTGRLKPERKNLVFSPDEKLYILKKLLQEIEENCLLVDEAYCGSENFVAKEIKEVFQDSIRRKYTIGGEDSQTGKSQISEEAGRYQVDLTAPKRNWYAYTDNFGTSEEKSLVKELDLLMEELEEKWSDIYLLRNEKAVKIYNFEDGKAFEPDFLLFANDLVHGNVSWQICIEPKGGQFIGDSGTFSDGKEAWKEMFLLEITQKTEAKTLVDNDRYRIIGMPFYNEQHTRAGFIEELRTIDKA